MSRALGRLLGMLGVGGAVLVLWLMAFSVAGSAQRAAHSDTSVRPEAGVTGSGAVAPIRLSCPSTTLCVAVDGAGHVITSTQPKGSAAWLTVDVDGTHAINDVACPSGSLCVAV